MMLALLIAAGVQGQAPARLHLPKAMREERSETDGALPLSVFASPEVLAALGPLRPRVGSWAEYGVQTRSGQAMRVKFSILPPSLEGGRYWLEMDIASEEGAATAVRLLVHRSPARMQDIERATVYVQGQAPLEIPLADLRAETDDPGKEDEGGKERKPSAAKIRRLAPESLKVPAGAFDKAEHFEVAGTRIWRSGRVPLWGLLRSKSRSQNVELIGYAGAGAHTLIQGNGNESVK